MTVDLLLAVLGYGAVFGLPFAAGGVAVLRRRQLLRRQRALALAEAALTGGGFTVERELEGVDGAARRDADPEMLTVSLRGSRGDALSYTLEYAGTSATCTLRLTGLGLVKRMTFTIGREDAVSLLARRVGIADIEVGDASLDGALKLKGWPVADVRGVIAAPAVRGALTRLFSRPGMAHVRLSQASSGLAAAGDGTGVLSVRFSVPWSELATVSMIAEELEELARALDDARWVEALGRPSRVLRISAASESGAPLGVPGTRDG